MVSLHAVFQLELHLGVVWGELEADFVNELRGEGEVGPSLQVLVALMLKLVLSTFVELDHHVANIGGCRHVHRVLNRCLLEVICEDSERFRCRWSRDLLQKIVAESVLQSWVFKEDGLWSDVENTVVSFHYGQKTIPLRFQAQIVHTGLLAKKLCCPLTCHASFGKEQMRAAS